MSYKSAELIGNTIYVVDNAGKHISYGFPIKLGIYSDHGPEKDLFGNAVEPVVFHKIKDAREFLFNSKNVPGMDKILVQYLARYDGIELNWSDWRIASVDIENEFDPSKPYQRGDYSKKILSISITIFNTTSNKTVIYGYHKAEEVSGVKNYRECSSEKDLLEKFTELLRKSGASIITGWNTSGHDMPYIIHRMEVNGVDVNSLSQFFDPSKQRLLVNHRDPSNPTIAGLTHIDYKPLYQKYNRDKLTDYKLDTVAQHEEVGQKVDYSEYRSLMGLYRENPTLFYQYNGEDSDLIRKIEEKKKFLMLAASISTMAGIRIGDYHSQIAFWDADVWKEAERSNIFIPPFRPSVKQEFEGAYVKKTIPGFFEDVVTFDAESLYPSVMRGANISIEKYLGKGEKIDGASYCPNGARFSTDSPGIMNICVTKKFRLRQSIKKEMKEIEAKMQLLQKGSSEYEALAIQKEVKDIAQLTVKLAINSLYGIHGSEFWRYYNVDIAEAITTMGAFINQHVMFRVDNWIEMKSNRLFSETDEYLNSVKYPNSVTDELKNIISADTDSLYGCFNNLVPKGLTKEERINFLDNLVKTSIKDVLTTATNEIVEVCQLMENTLNYKREALAESGVWRAKKQYCMRVWDNEGVRYSKPKLKVAGLEQVKVSTPTWAKEKLEELYDVLLDNKDPAKFMKDTKAWYSSLPLSVLAKPQKVNGIEKFTADPKGAGPAAKGSIVYNALLKKHKIVAPPIESGANVFWLYLRLPNPANSESVAFTIEGLPKEFGLDPFIDKEEMYVSNFYSGAESLCSAAKWDLAKKKNRLDRFLK